VRLLVLLTQKPRTENPAFSGVFMSRTDFRILGLMEMSQLPSVDWSIGVLPTLIDFIRK